ncbi:MAG: hypothetical protein AAF628_15410 [Planctomycetota bacterium]
MTNLRRTAVLLVALATPSLAQVAPYGAGTPGSGGITPRIWVDGEPRLGNLGFQVKVDRGLGGTTAALALSDQAARVPVAGTQLLLDPLSPLFVLVGPTVLGGTAGAAGDGFAAQPFGIPDLPALEGFDIFAQWYLADSGSPGGLAASDAVRLSVRRDAAVLGTLSTGFESLTPSGTSAVQPWPPTVISGGGVDLTADGRTASVILFDVRFGQYMALYDATTQPPAPLPVVVFGDISSAAIHPREDLAYAAVDGIYGSAISIIDVDRDSPSFGSGIAGVTGVPSFVTGPVDISADGRVLITPFFLTGLAVVDVDPDSPTRNTVLRELFFPFGLPVRLRIAADGTSAFAGMADSIVQYDLTTGQIVAQTAPLSGTVGAIEIDPRGRFLVAQTGSALTVLDLEPGPSFFSSREIAIEGAVTDLALAADGATVLVGMGNQYVVYDLATGIGFGEVTSSGQVSGFALR